MATRSPGTGVERTGRLAPHPGPLIRSRHARSTPAHASDSPAISADGRYVAFRSEANEFYAAPTSVVDYDVWLEDLATGAIRLVSLGGGGQDTLGASLEVALDATVVFSTLAVNVVAPDGNDVADVFVASKALRPRAGSAARTLPDRR